MQKAIPVMRDCFSVDSIDQHAQLPPGLVLNPVGLTAQDLLTKRKSG